MVVALHLCAYRRHQSLRKVVNDFSRRGVARRERIAPQSGGFLRSVPVFLCGGLAD